LMCSTMRITVGMSVATWRWQQNEHPLRQAGCLPGGIARSILAATFSVVSPTRSATLMTSDSVFCPPGRFRPCFRSPSSPSSVIHLRFQGSEQTLGVSYVELIEDVPRQEHAVNHREVVGGWTVYSLSVPRN